MNGPDKCPKCESTYICRAKQEREYMCTDCDHHWVDPTAETFSEAVARIKKRVAEREALAAEHLKAYEDSTKLDGKIY